MNDLIDIDRLRTVILQQGIVTRLQLDPDMDFRKDLGYNSGDIAELARLIAAEFNLSLTAEQVDGLSTIRSMVSLMNQLKPVSNPVNTCTKTCMEVCTRNCLRHETYSGTSAKRAVGVAQPGPAQRIATVSFQ